MRTAALGFGLLGVLCCLQSAISQDAATGDATRSAAAGSEVASSAVAPLPKVYFRQNTFVIPYAIETSDPRPVEVLLLVSADYGARWTVYARQSALQGQFVFRAARDGEYWFSSRTVAPGMAPPQDGPPQPEHMVVVDTAPPQLDVQASANSSGEIEVSWTATDFGLDPQTFRLEYQPALGQPWQPVRVEAPGDERNRGMSELAEDGSTPLTIRGQTRWRPVDGSVLVVVRASVQDKAGNPAQMVRRLFSPLSFATRPAPPPPRAVGAVPSDPLAAHGFASAAAAGAAGAYAATGEPAAAASAAPQLLPTDSSGSAGANSAQQAAAPTAPPQGPAAAPTGAGEPTSGPSVSLTDEEPRSAAPAEAVAVPWPSDDGQGAKLDAGQQLATGETPPVDPASPGLARQVSAPRYPNNTPLAAEPSPPNDTPPDPASPADDSSGLPAGERPHMVRTRRFNLDYSIDAVGPTGVEKVELWVTRDGGRDWDLWGVDEDRESPLLVAVDQDGIFGFRVVIVSKNGLASQTPEPGDLADLWVGVDTALPTAEITAAAYGSGPHAGQLQIRWLAADDFPGSRPIKLLFSERSDGPWIPIASGLPNDGSYLWRVDSRVPDQFYLRLEMRDEAGNLAFDELDEPIRSAGLIPKGFVRGLTPAGQ